MSTSARAWSLDRGRWWVDRSELARPTSSGLDGRVFEVRVDDRTCTTSEGSASRPAVLFTMGAESLDQLFVGGLTAVQAIADGSVKVAGDAGAITRFQDMFPAA